MRVSRLGLLLVGLVVAVGVVPSQTALGTATTCSTSVAVPAPWLDLPPADNASEDVLPDVVSTIRHLAGDRWGGVWESSSAEGRSLNIGIVGLTDADEALVKSDAQKFTSFSYPVVAHDVGLPRSVLEAAMPGVVDLVAEGISGTSVISIRPDLNKIVVDAPSAPSAEVISAATKVVPSCAVAIEVQEGLRAELTGRFEMPPYRAGKTIKTFYDNDPGEPGPDICTSAFAYELDGSGQQPLRGSSAGHCTQGIVDVYDGHGRDGSSPEGQTVSPNLWRATSPADGDAVFFSLTFGRSDVQHKIDTDPDESVVRNVISRVTTADFGNGYNVCKAGITSNETCGDVVNDFPTTITNVPYRDHNAHTWETKSVNKLACSDNFATAGDSGAPVYHKLAEGVASVGIHSLHLETQSGVFIKGCWTPTSYVGDQMGAHVWLGD
jgi:hypothetical protein